MDIQASLILQLILLFGGERKRIKTKVGGVHVGTI